MKKSIASLGWSLLRRQMESMSYEMASKKQEETVRKTADKMGRLIFEIV